MPIRLSFALFALFCGLAHAAPEKTTPAKPNVLFLIADDLTYTALSCYGNTVCQTPNIDRLAARGTLFTRAFCQATYCGPSRASFMFGFYPHATGTFGYVSGRDAVGPKRVSWAQHFKDNGYHSARVSKIFHMGVPIGIEQGSDGPDDAASWSEKYNSKGPEWRAPGDGETLQTRKKNPTAEFLAGKQPPVGGNTFVVVEADGDDMVHSDGKTAAKAVELLHKYKDLDKPFWLGVGFVRPHIPFVAPRKYFEPFKPYDKLVLPEKRPGDWDDIPAEGINYCTSKNMHMDVRKQKKALGGYYASVAYMDAQVGKVLDALEATGQDKNTIVIFTSDHGFHLGEHDFWAKVSLRDESAGVPLIISVPGKKAQRSDSFVELLDLYPTTAALCGIPAPAELQGKNIAPLLDLPQLAVRDYAVSATGSATLFRTDRWSLIRYRKGMEFFDVHKDPKQFTNLANNPEYAEHLKYVLKRMDNHLESCRNTQVHKDATAAAKARRDAKNKAKK